MSSTEPIKINTQGKFTGRKTTFWQLEKSRQQQSFFIILSLITNSSHGVFTNHNRRFYYNSFSDQLEPIYYDSNSRYQSLNHKS